MLLAGDLVEGKVNRGVVYKGNKLLAYTMDEH
jgi:hypothetical protein